jgi:DNA-binding transcriptional MocR family regulator
VMILASELRYSARLVALVLSMHMDRNGGSCFPSLTTLARESGLGRSTVVRALAQIEEAGLIQRVGGSHGKPTRYQARSPTTGLLVVPQRDGAVPQRASAAGHKDVQESVHNISNRAQARKQRKGRTAGARSDWGHFPGADAG